MQFWHLVYSASGTTAKYTSLLTASVSKRAGWVYVTNGNSGLSTLPAPSLWSLEVSTVGNATV